MCGICGLVLAGRERTPEDEILRAMAAPLASRGPDDEGFHRAPGIGLGHRRLRVIDLEGGRQPMVDESGRIVLSYNGEIYNHLELRRELEGRGVRFRTRSDTEVLLAGYVAWGEGVLDRLSGMFAFALWDERDETLLLARDHLGKKPLYWTSLADGGVAFASEPDALAACPGVDVRVDPRAAAGYLSVGYVVGEASILAGIRRLAPASKLVWRRGGAPRTSRYWDLASVWAARGLDGRGEPELAEEFRGLLAGAVQARLESDVPLGTFLSGGLDSSTVTALVARERPSVRTYSIGFAEASYSELPWARQVASALGVSARERVVAPEDAGLLLEVAASLAEPFADTSILPTFALCKIAREEITVALSGDGADELLAGYVTLAADRLHRRLSVVPRPARRALRGALDLLPESRRKVNWLFKAKKFLAADRLDACDAHASWRMLAPTDAALRLLAPEVVPAGFDAFEPFRRAWDEGAALRPLDRLLYVDFATWLPDDILFKVDRASMAHGLEVRCPFLDRRLIEFAAGLPPRLKLGSRRGKVLLRRAAAGLVPDAVLHRRKEGFNSPVSAWLAGSWRDLVEDAFSARSLEATGLLARAEVERLWQEHLGGRRDHGYLLFAVLMLVLWSRRSGP